jgi:hypothetical protein
VATAELSCEDPTNIVPTAHLLPFWALTFELSRRRRQHARPAQCN